MSATDLLRNVASKLTTPLLPDDYTRLLNPLWTARQNHGVIVEVRPETADAATVVIKPGWGWRFDHQAGQYVGIGVQIDGRWHWRSYSLSSPPSRDAETITVTVKAMPEGFLSTHLVRGLAPGTVVRLALPQGEFVLPSPPPAKLLFWTGGSGITPVMAMLRQLARRDEMPDVAHVHSAPTRDSVIFGSELEALGEAHPSYSLLTNIDAESGLLDVERLTSAVPDWREREAWVCGPAPMLKSAERKWREAGLAERLHIERFSTELSSSASGGHVTFGTLKEADLDGATTLLEGGEAAGVNMPFGCRMGICHTCVVPLKKGRVKDLRDGHEYVEGQRIQTCVTAAAGDCILDI
ncbi:MAG: stearoyl-CoA 9-desaturase oxidoreductase [Frankiales bacterium]|jgi:ferredoxin-NADP reductase|nr:stearoyl-CoA 9-desaturase oxidoreductase [Frankiales bacterium]